MWLMLVFEYLTSGEMGQFNKSQPFRSFVVLPYNQLFKSVGYLKKPKATQSVTADKSVWNHFSYKNNLQCSN